MHQDTAEVYLESVDMYEKYQTTVSLRIFAYLTEGGQIDQNTIVFRCDPAGDNYDLAYLSVVFDKWSYVAEIRDFLSHHFSDEIVDTRTRTFDLAKGSFSIRPYGREGYERDGLEEMRITASGERIEFGGVGSMEPYIYTYTHNVDGQKLDNHNAEKLLSFFDEILNAHPNYRGGTGSDVQADSFYDAETVKEHIELIAGSNSSIIQDYRKAVREYENEIYEDSVRDLGNAAELFIELLCEEIYDRGDIPDKTGRQLNKLDKTEDGVKSMVGKSISPLWWLRNQVSHSTGYDLTREEAKFALLCFQIALVEYSEKSFELERS